MERAEYNRHSRARMAETAKDASRHAAPDAPERIDHRRRCTRHDHRTCCRGSRGSASLPCHTLRKRVEMGHAGSRRRPILNATTSPLTSSRTRPSPTGRRRHRHRPRARRNSLLNIWVIDGHRIPNLLPRSYTQCVALASNRYVLSMNTDTGSGATHRWNFSCCR